jgi:hypothetical protein
LEYVADETTGLGLVLLSGFFKKPILLITSREPLACFAGFAGGQRCFQNDTGNRRNVILSYRGFFQHILAKESKTAKGRLHCQSLCQVIFRVSSA